MASNELNVVQDNENVVQGLQRGKKLRWIEVRKGKHPWEKRIHQRVSDDWYEAHLIAVRVCGYESISQMIRSIQWELYAPRELKATVAAMVAALRGYDA